MNDWNLFEKQMRSWTPRRPSRSLKSRLFGSRISLRSLRSLRLTAAGRAEGWSWNSLGPALALLFVVFAALSDRRAAPGENYGALSTLALSNQAAAFYHVTADLADRNSVPAHSFASTRGRGFHSSNGSFLILTTNRLMQ